MENKFDVKDMFNNIIPGVLWLLFLWQIDAWVFCGRLRQLICTEGNWAFSFLFLLIIVFLLGVLLRPFEVVPKKLFNWLIGDPIDLMFYKDPSKKEPLLKKILRVLLLLVKFNRPVLSKTVRKTVEALLKSKGFKEEKPVNKLVYVESLFGNENRYGRAKNYKNLVESIMFPEFLNVFVAILKPIAGILDQKTLDIPVIQCILSQIAKVTGQGIPEMHGITDTVLRIAAIVFFLLLGLINMRIVFGRYNYYKAEYVHSVFRSVLQLPEAVKLLLPEAEGLQQSEPEKLPADEKGSSASDSQIYIIKHLKDSDGKVFVRAYLGDSPTPNAEEKSQSTEGNGNNDRDLQLVDFEFYKWNGKIYTVKQFKDSDDKVFVQAFLEGTPCSSRYAVSPDDPIVKKGTPIEEVIDGLFEAAKGDVRNGRHERHNTR
ncbi:MAG: hypothetical protein MdMp014T_0161 [Treponematales bacterium]